MQLTPDIQAKIDGYGVEQLLAHIRFASIGDERFTGETGAYWLKALEKKMDADLEAYVNASKRIGWTRGGSVPPYFSGN